MHTERQSYWRDTNGIIFSEDKIVEQLGSETNGIYIFDGKSGCGKSRILCRLHQQRNDLRIFSAEDITRILVSACQKNTPETLLIRLTAALSESRCVAIEDIDFLRGRTTTLEILIETIQTLAHDHVVVINGNDLDYLVPEVYTMRNRKDFRICR